MELQIINENGELLVDSRAIADGFGIDHKSLRKSLSEHFSDLKSLKSVSSGGRPGEYFLLTEQQALITPAIAKTTKLTVQFQTALVDAFLAMRKQLQTVMPTDPKAQAILLATQLLASNADVERLENEVSDNESTINMLSGFIETDKPKVDLHDKLMASKSCITMKEMANLLGTGRTILFKWLRDNRMLMEGRYHNQPYQRNITRGFFETRENILKNGYIRIQTLVTSKGQSQILKAWNDRKQLKLEGN